MQRPDGAFFSRVQNPPLKSPNNQTLIARRRPRIRIFGADSTGSTGRDLRAATSRKAVNLCTRRFHRSDRKTVLEDEQRRLTSSSQPSFRLSYCRSHRRDAVKSAINK
jgi:hypothetical protein